MECQFRNDIKEDPELQEYEPNDPLKPRDAFYGGKTNAITHYDMSKEEVLRYVDLTLSI